MPAIRAADVERRRRADAEELLAERTAERDEMSRHAAEVKRQSDQIRRELDVATDELTDARAATQQARADAAATQQALDAVLGSRVWRSTSWWRRLRSGATAD